MNVVKQILDLKWYEFDAGNTTQEPIRTGLTSFNCQVCMCAVVDDLLLLEIMWHHYCCCYIAMFTAFAITYWCVTIIAMYRFNELCT